MDNDKTINMSLEEAKNANQKKASAKSENKKKKSPVANFFKAIGIFILVILLLIIGWFTFCTFNKQNTASAIPENYTLYVRTDSAWNALEPILDLKATDLVMADKTFAPFRESFYNFRQSGLRNNFFVKKALQRRIDIAVYDDKSYLVVANMGFLSGITRLLPYYADYIPLDGFSYNQTAENSYFIYRVKNQSFYIKTQKNLVIISQNEDLFRRSITFTNDSHYTDTKLKAITEKISEPFKITCDGTKLLGMLASDNSNPYVTAVSKAISMDQMSTISFDLTDADLSLKAFFPFEINHDYKEHAVTNLLKEESTVPSLLNKLPENVQYYTFINSISIDQIKEAGFSVLPKSMKIDDKWEIAEKASNIIFHDSIEDAFFSWTDDEIAIFGLEGKAEPVIAIKISDEKLRQEKFDNVLSSIILQSNNSLLVDSVRLPRIEVPGFIQSILEAFGVNLPKPYYIEKDGYLYLSQSPENLVSVNNANQNNKRISNNDNWKHVSSKMSPLTTISLYYNLERSIPFFLKSQTTVSQILQLYNIGRFDVCSKNNQLTIQLNATVSQEDSSNHIPGFPKDVAYAPATELCKSNTDKSKTIFYLEGNSHISAMNTASLAVTTKEFKDINFLIPATTGTTKQNNGELWAVGKSGIIYLLTKDLDIVSGYPIMTDRITAKPVTYQNYLLFTTETGYIEMINPEGDETYFETEFDGAIQASPSSCDTVYAVYEKGFLGGIHLYNRTTELTEDGPLLVDGIGYGSPCVYKSAKKTYVAFITQDGLLYVFDDQNNTLPNFPLQLDGIFYVNVTEADGYLFALSQTGSLFRIGHDASVLEVEIPYFKAKYGTITAVDLNSDNKKEILVSGEGNTIYGFTGLLDMLEGFPVSGYSEPVFTDVSGDKKDDCIALSIDNKLNAYKIQ